MIRFVILCLSLYIGSQYAVGKPVTDYKYGLEAGAELRLHTVATSMPSAALHCQFQGGLLASPISNAILLTMKEALNEHQLSSTGVLIGATDLFSKGSFKTLEGLDVNDLASEWAEGEPNNQDEAEDCVMMTGMGKLVAVNCASVYPYFCHIKPQKSDRKPVSQCLSGYEWEPRTGSCYKLHEDPEIWPRALASCHAEGAYLAIINSDVESTVLKEIGDRTLTEKYKIFSGFMKIGNKWLTIFGDTLKEAGFKKWDEGEPSNTGGVEFCGSMTSKGLLNDAPCVHHAWSFICEYTP